MRTLTADHTPVDMSKLANTTCRVTRACNPQLPGPNTPTSIPAICRHALYLTPLLQATRNLRLSTRVYHCPVRRLIAVTMRLSNTISCGSSATGHSSGTAYGQPSVLKSASPVSDAYFELPLT